MMDDGRCPSPLSNRGIDGAPCLVISMSSDVVNGTEEAPWMQRLWTRRDRRRIGDTADTPCFKWENPWSFMMIHCKKWYFSISYFQTNPSGLFSDIRNFEATDKRFDWVFFQDSAEICEEGGKGWSLGKLCFRGAPMVQSFGSGFGSLWTSGFCEKTPLPKASSFL